jgi:MinD superfamily P-loop ATPase
MRQLVVLSGKGGTGKTTVAAALAHLAAQEGPIVIVDADVDAPNLELLLQPEIIEDVPFFGGKKAHISAERCTACGRCEEVCRYAAVAQRDGTFYVDLTACEGCASCFYQCPAQAIEMRERQSGDWFRSKTRFGPFLHARLIPGEENSGKLVSVLRQQALLEAHESETDWIIIDGAPGIGCPVIAAVTGADLALLVSEPTVSGVHDLKRAIEICEHFRVPASVCINKVDINPSKAQEIAAYCAQHGIPVSTRIPYDEVVVKAMRRGCAVTEWGESVVAEEIKLLWLALRDHVKAQ